MGDRKRVRHYEEPGHCRELTFSCYRRRPLLTNDVRRSMLGVSVGRAADVEENEIGPILPTVGGLSAPETPLAILFWLRHTGDFANVSNKMASVTPQNRRCHPREGEFVGFSRGGLGVDSVGASVMLKHNLRGYLLARKHSHHREPL